MEVLNWSMLKHPMNWVVVTLMVLIAAIALHFVMQYQTAPDSPSK